MIGRRAFTLGLGSLLLAPAALAQEVSADERKRLALRNAPIVPLEEIPNHREMMREIVWKISSAAKKVNPNFSVLVRNAPELLITEKREWDWESYRDPDGAATGKYAPLGSVVRRYLKSIDGMVIDGLFCGREAYGTSTDQAEAKTLNLAAKALAQEGRTVLTIEYCKEKQAVARAEKLAGQAKTLTYVDQDGNNHLGHIPAAHPARENPDHVTTLAEARDWLPMFHSESFASREDWVAAMCNTNYDLLLVDPFWRGSESLVKSDVTRLKLKALGTQRLVMAVLPVGDARDTAFYWKRDWEAGNPAFLKQQEFEDPSRWMVEYWSDDWKAIISKYLQGLMTLGFDGIMLDGADAYLSFEELMPID